MDYYRRFLRAFPGPAALARAPEQEVLRLWQGLGYYSRARNLHRAAREIMEENRGVMPATYADWLKIRGVGPYTAAAIASIAFGEAVPALDGNVYRVLARLFALSHNMDTAGGKVAYKELASSLIDPARPGDFNQAMMDFGSLVCKPVSPLCGECLFARECLALRRKSVHLFPVRNPKKRPSDRYFHYLLCLHDLAGGQKGFFVGQRMADDIWKHLWEYPLLESSEPLGAGELMSTSGFERLFPGGDGFRLMKTPVLLKHQLTHRTIHAWFYTLQVGKEAAQHLQTHFRQVDDAAFEQLPKPRLIERFLALAP